MDSSAPTCYRCGKVDFTNHSCNPAEVYRTATPTPRTSNGSLNVQNRLVSLRIDRSLSSKKKSIKVKKVNITFFQGALIPDSDDIFNEKIIQLSTVGLNYLFKIRCKKNFISENVFLCSGKQQIKENVLFLVNIPLRPLKDLKKNKLLQI